MDEGGHDDDLVDLKWIANTAVVGASTVSNWRKRDNSFPTRAGGTEGRPLFSKHAILEWGRATGRFSANAALGMVTSRERARAVTAEMRNFVPPRMFLEAAVRVFAAIADLSIPEWTSSRSSGEGRRSTQLGSFALDDLDASVVERMSSTIRPMVEAQDLSAVFEEVIDQLSEREIDQPSSSALADAMIALVDAGSGTVLDPAAGIGTLLIRARETLDARTFVAWEIDVEALSVLWLRFQLRGWPIHIEHRDSLESENHSSTAHADILLLDPPFGVLLQRQRMEIASGRNERKQSATKDWIDMATSQLAPGGLAVVHLPSAIASDRSAMSDRADLITSGALRAVVSLPAGIVPGAHANFATDLWVLGNQQVAPTANVRMVDASGIPANEIGVALRGVLGGKISEVQHVRALDVNRFELLRNDAVITPERWTESRYTEDDARLGLESVGESLQLFGRDLGEMSAIGLTLTLAESGSRSESLRSLREAGHVTRVYARPAAVKRDTARLIEARVLTGKALRDPAAATIERVDPRSMLLPGDVVHSEVGTSPTVKVWAEDGWALGSAVTAWRITSDDLIPEYLRLVLSSGIAAAIGTRGASVPRFDPQLMQIPILPLADQLAIVAQLRSIENAIGAMTEARGNLIRARDALTDAAAAGWLRADLDNPNHLNPTERTRQ